MDIREYEINAKKTLADLPLDKQNIHLILGMVTEAGELADVFKKYVAYGREIDWVNVTEEIGDLMWYIINFCTTNNLNFFDILEANIAKLQARYGGKFSAEKANNRNLAVERKILER